jgi:hypothetical protein
MDIGRQIIDLIRYKKIESGIEVIRLLRSFKYSGDKNERNAYRGIKKLLNKQSLDDIETNLKSIPLEEWNSELERRKQKSRKKLLKSPKPKWIHQ